MNRREFIRGAAADAADSVPGGCATPRTLDTAKLVATPREQAASLG